MRWRQIQLSSEQVRDIIKNPDSETPTVENRTNSWRRRGEDWVRVTWIIENNVMVVVSVNRDEDGPSV
jgi:2',3'-cyclic-nucleotide 2'-phosphodiesterase (5'-nucleotidase family)